MMFQKPIWAPNVILVNLPEEKLEDSLLAILKHIGLEGKMIGINAVNDDEDLDFRKMIIHQEDYEIYRERYSNSKTVSAYLLKAGVKIAYCIEANEDSYRAAFAHMYDLIGNDYPIVCVSSSLGQHIESAITIVDRECSNSENSKTIFLTLDNMLKNDIKYQENHFIIE